MGVIKLFICHLSSINLVQGLLSNVVPSFFMLQPKLIGHLNVLLNLGSSPSNTQDHFSILPFLLDLSLEAYLNMIFIKMS